ncbi:MAG TPA: hypothetical protein VJI98_04905 [Candidatus Nanoarchaeia archaeon]|nr:hypothetical protein [Candidatus Nanoarchaeia archaeon]
MMNKKGDQQIWWIIVAAVLAFIVVILILVWFRGSGTRIFENVDTNIEGLKDCDGDKAADFFDACPCDPSATELNSGETCPTTKELCGDKIKQGKCS